MQINRVKPNDIGYLVLHSHCIIMSRKQDIMKIKFLGTEYPIVNITFTSHGIAVTYLDDRSSAPGLKLITMSFEEFHQNASFLEVA